jgi:N-acetyl-gamma-glutamyl-phosphate reductase
VRVAIVGATGYTGCELLDILLRHPRVEVTSLTAKLETEVLIREEFPRFNGRTELICSPLVVEEVCDRADFVFLSLPHGVSMKYAPAFCGAGKRVIDLSADFRFRDPSVYKRWYGREHEAKELLQKAVYGFPELDPEQIEKAEILANPGCYPTGAVLALIPLFKKEMVALDDIIIDAKSGVTGAGRKASLALSFGECNESLRAYRVGTHQHTPEIESVLTECAGTNVRILFTPTLVPMNRGILTTAYLKPLGKTSDGALREIYTRFYEDAPFVRVLEKGQLPDTKDVVGLNYCDVSAMVEARTGRIVVISAIDNLVKGAAGQAVQNMNLMCGFPETMALTAVSGR